MCFLGHLVLLLCILTISNVLHSQNPLILLPHLPHLMLFLLFQPMTLTLISQTKWKLSHGNFSISLVYNHENFCLNLFVFFFLPSSAMACLPAQTNLPIFALHATLFCLLGKHIISDLSSPWCFRQ